MKFSTNHDFKKIKLILESRNWNDLLRNEIRNTIAIKFRFDCDCIISDLSEYIENYNKNSESPFFNDEEFSIRMKYVGEDINQNGEYEEVYNEEKETSKHENEFKFNNKYNRDLLEKCENVVKKIREKINTAETNDTIISHSNVKKSTTIAKDNINVSKLNIKQ